MRSEEEEHAKTIRETILWLNGASAFKPPEVLGFPSHYGLLSAQRYFEGRVKSATYDTAPDSRWYEQQPVTFESLDRKMEAGLGGALPDPTFLRGGRRERAAKPAIPLTKTGKPDKRTVNALKRRAAAAKSAGKKVKGRK